MGRTLWKALGVPAVTYAGDVLAYSTPAMKCLDRHQNELGRWLLGGNSATATAAVTGEMGWSPYEIREARSKILYAGRLKFMPETNVSKRIYLHLRYRNIKTHWIRRITALEAKYGRDSKRHETKSAAAWDKVTIKEITEANTKAWRAAVAKKQSLTLYAKHTTEPQQRPFYRGDRESGLFFQARTGSLLTQQRRHELFGSDPRCRLCGAPSETVDHILYECPKMPVDVSAAKVLAESLALSGNSTQDRAREAVLTKQRLRLWEQHCRHADADKLCDAAASQQRAATSPRDCSAD